MAVREFTDSAGMDWRVWDTIPLEGRLLRPELREGWLTFESTLGRFRLAPVPDGWERAPTAKLELLCRLARAGGARAVRLTASDLGHEDRMP